MDGGHWTFAATMLRNEVTAPLTFQPIFIERMWGGRRLESEFHKKLPPRKRIGESWEIVDRSEAQSVVTGGPLGGRTLHELWTQQREEIFGDLADTPRFPLLIKILDAQEKLSLQVHPPENVASKLGGEPKSEFWYVAAANPDAEVFVGFREPITRDMFEEKLRNGTVIDYIHKIAVRAGDAIFLPAGRVHAIGAGNLLIEIQQNSDTTYPSVRLEPDRSDNRHEAGIAHSTGDSMHRFRRRAAEADPIARRIADPP